jgi:hypothetical protein
LQIVFAEIRDAQRGGRRTTSAGCALVTATKVTDEAVPAGGAAA